MATSILKIVVSVFAIFLMCLPTSHALAENQAELDLLETTNSCVKCNLSSMQLIGKNLKGADISEAQLVGADLSDSTLKRSNLVYANFHNANLSNADLSFSTLVGANLSGANLSNSILSGANLTGTDLSGANLENVRFSGVLGAAILNSVTLEEASLTGSNLDNVKMVKANLKGSDLRDTSFWNAELQYANFAQSNLEGAKFQRANLIQANLKDTILKDSSFSYANLEGADFTGASFENADLSDANLQETIGLDPYGINLLEKGLERGKAKEYLTAIEYLEKIPSQTNSYSEAKRQITEFRYQYNEQKARETVKQAEQYAASGNYEKALKKLAEVPTTMQSYNIAVSKSRDYVELYKQQLRQKAKLTGEVSAEMFGDDWPFTVPEGRIKCGGGEVYFASGAQKYPLNGIARAVQEDSMSMNYRPLEEIWRSSPDTPGTKINVGEFIKIGLALCR